MKAVVKRVGSQGMTLVGKGSSNHWIPLDGTEDFGGYDAASRPLELILIGLAGCTSMDVLSILRKMKVPLDDYELQVEGVRAEEHPKVFTHIAVNYLFYGTDIDPAKVEKAIKLSEERYCSVAPMLRATVEMETTYEILPPR
ncbi:MAG: OsmC family protein [Candidatus Delongbacteria bacterium]|nr:OsmC family protein [Candidatus Delongbacteria bacterium]